MRVPPASRTLYFSRRPPVVRVRAFALMGGVSVNWVRRRPGPAASAVATGPFDTTVHASGAMTDRANLALRSGCSKQAYIRRASAASNWVYR